MPDLTRPSPGVLAAIAHSAAEWWLLNPNDHSSDLQFGDWRPWCYCRRREVGLRLDAPLAPEVIEARLDEKKAAQVAHAARTALAALTPAARAAVLAQFPR